MDIVGPPDFIYVGFPKTGSTWLYRKLNELPEFNLPPIKEIHYFDRSNKYPSSNYLSKSNVFSRLLDPKWSFRAMGQTTFNTIHLDFPRASFFYKWYFKKYNDNWYLNLFKGFDGITGDITPTYCLLNEIDIYKIYQLLPKVKLIFIIRDPIERAWSHFRMYAGKNNINISSLSDDQISDFLSSSAQTLRTNYTQSIDKYKEVFPGGSIYIGFYDHLQENPNKFLKNIVRFLGGNPDSVDNYCDIHEKVHTSIKSEIPDNIYTQLKEKNQYLILELSKKYKSYCEKWEFIHFGNFIENNQAIELNEYLII